MPQAFQTLVNKTVQGTGLAQATSPPDSLRVQFRNMERGDYVEINGIAWGVESGVKADLGNLDFGDLMILRNEIFDSNFLYTPANCSNSKDLIFTDVITTNQRFNYRDFERPFKLDDSPNYLIIMNAPVNGALATTPYNCVLTVRAVMVAHETAVIQVSERIDSKVPR